MARTVIELDGVGKRYRLGEHRGGGTDLRDAIGRAAGRLQGTPRRRAEELWSLRDVSFQVVEGEAVGIVGSNGAGKSTLLKIVSNIVTPTEGRCRTRGRVGPLLEVGAGFHGELTGRENTYLNGAILGMSRKEVARRLDEIVAFAGMERFMDTPVKRYSSGMYLRLGFSIAAHLEADILVVDEVLAVGDAEFQRRCLGKMGEVEANGRTVLFVSHDADAVVRLCPTALWLDQGTVRMVGPAEQVVGAYLRSNTTPSTGAMSAVLDPTLPAQVTGVRLVDVAGAVCDVLPPSGAGAVEVDLAVHERVPGLDVAVMIETSTGLGLLDEDLSDATERSVSAPGTYRLRCPLPAILTVGEYSVTIWLGSTYETIRFYERAVRFTVDGPDDGRRRVVKVGSPWHVEQLDDPHGAIGKVT